MGATALPSFDDGGGYGSGGLTGEDGGGYGSGGLQSGTTSTECSELEGGGYGSGGRSAECPLTEPTP